MKMLDHASHGQRAQAAKSLSWCCASNTHLVQASHEDSLEDAKTEANADISQVIQAIQANFFPNKSEP